MHYEGLVKLLSSEVLKNPLVRTVLYSPEAVSDYHNIRYGVFTYDTGQISITTDGRMSVSMSLYYINLIRDQVNLDDSQRFVEDTTRVQSQGIDVLHNLVKTLPIGIESVSYQVFTRKFLDFCAGAVANVTFTFPYSRCFDADLKDVDEDCIYYNKKND